MRSTSSRDHLRPWARPLPLWVLKYLMVLALPLYIIVGATSGIREYLTDWVSEWKML
jgi:hypothetical protein